MQSAKKYRGNIDKVIEDYSKDVIEQFNTPDLSVAFVTYTTATEGMISAAKKALEEKGFKEIYETRAGATISSHCGEHTLGILYINDGK
jgi:fatty acid-binding protein DegV